MEAVTTGFLEYGILGLVIAVLTGFVVALLKYIMQVKEQTQKSNTETMDKVLEITKDVTRTTERVSAVVEENTRVIEKVCARVDAMGEKVLVLGERVEKLEGK